MRGGLRIANDCFVAIKKATLCTIKWLYRTNIQFLH